MVIPWSSSSSEDEGDKPDEENEKVKVRPFNRALVEVEEKEYDFDKEEKKESDEEEKEEEEEEKGIETPVKRRSIKRKVTKNVVQLSSDEEEDTDSCASMAADKVEPEAPSEPTVSEDDE